MTSDRFIQKLTTRNAFSRAATRSDNVSMPCKIKSVVMGKSSRPDPAARSRTYARTGVWRRSTTRRRGSSGWAGINAGNLWLFHRKELFSHDQTAQRGPLGRQHLSPNGRRCLGHARNGRSKVRGQTCCPLTSAECVPSGDLGIESFRMSLFGCQRLQKDRLRVGPYRSSYRCKSCASTTLSKCQMRQVMRHQL